MTLREESQNWPYLERYSDIAMYNTKAVVQRTAVPAPTLRAWERRYALISPKRAENAYRLYSERDIALIRWLREHIDNGMSISQAIALFKYRSEEHKKHPADAEKVPYAASSELPLDVQSASQMAIRPPTSLYAQDTQFSIEEAISTQTERSHISDLVPGSTHPHILHTMDHLQEQLIDAFQSFNEAAANMLVGTLLTVYPIEQVCTEVITPTLWKIGQYWAEGRLTVSVEHFASNFFRALLTNLYHITPGIRDRSLVIVCSAPGEPHELAALMLALFLRRKGVSVVYLGQNIETTGLLHMIRQLSPALICVSLTIADYLPAFLHLARRILQIQPAPPTLAFGGQGFSDYEQFIDQIPGVYLPGDLWETTQYLQQITESFTKMQP